MSVYITSTKHPGDGSGSGDPATPFALRDTVPGASEPAPDARDHVQLTQPSVAIADRRSGPFVVELRVELAAMDEVPDRTGLVLEVVAEALRAKGWNPAVLIRVHESPGAPPIGLTR